MSNPNQNPSQREHAAPARVFQASVAVQEQTPLLLGIASCSGAGKTYSAHRLARGIQRVSGGKIYVLDSEARRALHYSSHFQFKLPDGSPGLYHVPFGAPFSPADYLAAIQFCVDSGAKVVIVDSFSHEHEGPGGVLEMHAEELKRLGGKPSMSLLAWGKPKSERRRLINSILQMNCNFIFCLRSKSKIKIIPGREPEERGFVPLGGDDLVFELTARFLLMPGSNGVPTLTSDFPEEQAIVKLPKMFEKFFANGSVQLSEDLGQHMAMWSAGTSVPAGMAAPPMPIAAENAAPAATTTAPVAATGVAATELPPLMPPAAATPDAVIALYAVAKTREEMKSLRPQFDAVFATASEADRVRMKAAGNAAADRTSAASAWGLTSTAATTPTISPVDAIISLYDRAPTRGVVRELRPQFDAVYDKASEVDRVRMNAAGKSAVDRLVAAQQGSLQTQTPQAPVQSQSPVASSLIDPALEALTELHAEGMAAFRSALDSFGPEITQEQAAQLVIDHMSEDAKEPKVSPEDGPTAQAEIMARVVPKFASKASLGVMVRHMTYCAKHRTYKAYCDDLALCETAMNVYECWRTNGAIVDAMPDEVKKEARLRTGKRVEVVDSTISQGGVWLTKKIKEAREAAGSGATTAGSGVAAAAPTMSAGLYDGPGLAKALSASSVSSVPPMTLGGMGAGVDSEVQTSTIRQAATNGNSSADIVRHAPIESDLGQRLALEIDGATIQTIPDIKGRIERVVLQKKLPTKDGEVLLSLYSEKLQALASA